MRAIVPLSLLTLLLGCPAAPSEEPDPTPAPRSYEATIRWTSYGIPHVLADDWGSAAFGMAHAHARDHACTLADQIVMVRSERARWFGRGTNDANVDSDFGWKALGVMEQAAAGLPTLPAVMREALDGYAAGFAAYLDEVGADGLPSPCRGAEWVQPFTAEDLLAYYLSLGLSGSGAVFVDAIAQAEPPSGARDARYGNDPTDPEALAAFRELMEPIREPLLGSNGWGIGGDASTTGGGLLLSNTHFPYTGQRRWWESHLTIPGELDVYGASLVGIPLINIGFNQDVAWTHTVSGTPRFTGYQLQLDPEDPTRYLRDGEYVAMEAREYTVQVPGFAGELVEETRTLYRSEYGPMINAPVVGWTANAAFTMRDANENNLAMLPTWFRMNQASDLDAFRAAHAEEQGIPWVHTMYADAAGNAWYTDSAASPNLSDAAWAGYAQYVEDNTFAALFADNGAVLLPGGDPQYDWVEEGEARAPGLVPFTEAPQLERGDFVANANDNHWMTNPAAPLTGYSPVYGADDTPRSPRTRMNLMYLLDDEGGAGADGRWTLDELQDAALGGRTSMGELLRAAVVERCTNTAGADAWPTDDGPVDLTAACAALDAWDGTVGLEAQGAQVFREFLGSGEFTRDDLWDEGLLWDEAFDPNDPVATPRGLATADEGDPILDALATAMQRLGEAGIALDARLGDIQFQLKDGTPYAMLGGREIEGAIAICDHGTGGDDTLIPRQPRGEVVNAPTDLTVDGYQVNRGNSWIFVMQFDESGQPRGRAVMTYSQSQDADRASFDDQTADLSATGTMRDVLFTTEEIEADPEYTVEVVTGGGM